MKSYQAIVLAVLCIALGVAASNMSNTPANAQSGGVTDSGSYQISAFGGGADSQGARYGAYVINTQTGKAWLIREGGGSITPIVGLPADK